MVYEGQLAKSATEASRSYQAFEAFSFPTGPCGESIDLGCRNPLPGLFLRTLCFSSFLVTPSRELKKVLALDSWIEMIFLTYSLREISCPWSLQSIVFNNISSATSVTRRRQGVVFGSGANFWPSGALTRSPNGTALSRVDVRQDFVFLETRR